MGQGVIAICKSLKRATSGLVHRPNLCSSAIRGFTLVELLVVISIIALLLAILMPSLARARRQVQKVVCANNQRQWGVALQAYASNNNNYFPYNGNAIPGVCEVGGQGLTWNSSTVQQFWKDYLIKPDSKMLNGAGGRNILVCPTDTWVASWLKANGGLQNSTVYGMCGYNFMPSRVGSTNNFNFSYRKAGDGWVTKKKFGGTYRAAPLMSDVMQLALSGIGAPYKPNTWILSDHMGKGSRPEGGNFLFEDSSVKYYELYKSGVINVDIGAVVPGVFNIYYKLPGIKNGS